MTSPNNVLTKTQKMNNGDDWLPHHIEIATLPPKDGLTQALDAFELDHPRFDGVIVLMAQMDYDSADELARHMESPKGLDVSPDPAKPGPAFDLVVARAETSHQTRPQTNTLLPPVSQGRSRFVVGPPPAYNDDTQEVQLPLGWAQISRSAGSATATFSVDLSYCQTNPSAEDCVPPPGSTSAWDEMISQLQSNPTGTYSECYTHKDSTQKAACSKAPQSCLLEFATCAMLQDNNATDATHKTKFDTEGSDVAVLQMRDVWVPPGNAADIHLKHAGSVQGVLDRIFWKDDLLAHANLSGSQLKTLMKESKAIQDDEKNPLWILHDTKGRGLSDHGLLKGKDAKPGSKDDPYYSHLDEITDTSLYRVAASTYISNGDTGYTEFASPAEGKVEFFRRDKKGVRISVLICEALADGAKHPDWYHCGEGDAQAKGGTVDEKDYAVSGTETQRIAGLIHDDREQDSGFEYIEAQVHELTTGRDPFSQEAMAASPTNATEKILQGYPYLDVNLINLSIAGNLNTALATRAETANFGGVLQSDIPQPTKSEFKWLTTLRVLDRRAHGRWDFGAAVDEQFDKSVQGSLTKPSNPSWSANSLTVGPIIQYSISDPRRGPRHLLTIHLTDYLRQITNTDLTLTGKNNSASFTFSQLPSQGFQPKGGYRYESGDSYFEIGGLYTRNYDVLSEVTNLPSGAVCNLSGSVSLAACVGALTFTAPIQTPILHYDTFGQAGIYWDSKLNLDVLQGKWSYQLTSKGNYYPKSDPVSALSRLDARLGNSLKFQLIGNFSLVPTAEWRFFETEGTRDFIKRINTSVALTYTFHKDSRVNLWDAMHNKAQAASASQ